MSKEDYMEHISKLAQESIWVEIARGLSGDNPETFIKGLHETGQLKTILPEVDALFGVPQPPEHHPEIDTGIHTLMTLKRAAELSDDLAVRYAALTHDLGKALTDPKEWPKQHGHEELGIGPAQAITKRLEVPKEISILAEHVVRDHVTAHRALELKPGKIVKLLERINAIQNPDMFEKFILSAQADAQGRLGFEDRPYPQAKLLKSALQAVRDVEINFSDKDLTDDVIIQKKVEAVKEVKNNMLKNIK
jgi:tRNA nucleotidyltransferase (CCA-adding enzyme)